MMLTEAIPLRSTTLWGGYRESLPIPHRYGEVTGRLYQYNAERTLFVWADHPVSAIRAVEVNGQPAGEWDWDNIVDSTGQAVAMVRFGQPVDQGVEPVATGTGKLHPFTGAIIDNPATIVWDVLANIAGIAVAETVLDDFRAACSALNIIAAGTVDGDDETVEVVNTICKSVGAVFSSDIPGLCRIWPGGALAPARTTIRTGAVAPRADLQYLANDITIEFDHADGAARQTLQVESVDSVAQRGRRKDTHSAPWISSPRVALEVASRLLRQRARPQWRIAAVVKVPVRVGDTVTFDHPSLPIVGAFMVVGRSLNTDADPVECAIELRIPVGAEPRARLVHSSTAFTPEQYAAVTVEAAGADYVVTLREQDGRPIAGAAVKIDGGPTRTSDSGGRVIIPATIATPGQHVLDIVTLDLRTLQTTVVI